MFVFVFLVVLLLPSFLFPFQTENFSTKPRILSYSAPQNTFKVLKVVEGDFRGNALEVLGFGQGLDLEKICEGLCKGELL